MGMTTMHMSTNHSVGIVPSNWQGLDRQKLRGSPRHQYHRQSGCFRARPWRWRKPGLRTRHTENEHTNPPTERTRRQSSPRTQKQLLPGIDSDVSPIFQHSLRFETLCLQDQRCSAYNNARLCAGHNVQVRLLRKQ